MNGALVHVFRTVQAMSGFIANWRDKIQGLFKDFQVPKIAVFKYQKYR